MSDLVSSHLHQNFSQFSHSFMSLCDPMDCTTPGFSIHHQFLLKLMCIELEMPSNHLILCHPLSSCLQSFPASGSFPGSQFFTSGGQSIGASASVLLMNIQDWFPLGLTGYLLAVQGTFNSLQHHSSKASVLWGSAFFIVQLSHPYMTTGKTIALTRWIFVGKVMSLLLNMLSRFVIAFLPRSKHLLKFAFMNAAFMAAFTVHNDFGAQGKWALNGWAEHPKEVMVQPSLTPGGVPPSSRFCREGPPRVLC